jgi:hypothetical protein
MFKNIKIYEWISSGIMLLVLVFGLYLSFNSPEYFTNTYVPEDGLLENMTALFLFFIALVMGWRLFKFRKGKSWLWMFTHIMVFLLFIFGAGEEISWGQRIFGIESSEFFEEHNTQDEMNLHNLEIGGVRLNTLIFSQLLSLALVCYFFIIPLIYPKWKWLKKLVNNFGLFLPNWHQSLFFLLCTIIVLLIPSDKKWELLELSFSFAFLVTVLNPFNADVIYTK